MAGSSNSALPGSASISSSKRGGVWELASDNPAVEAGPWPEEWEPVGEVFWVAHTLIEARRG